MRKRHTQTLATVLITAMFASSFAAIAFPHRASAQLSVVEVGDNLVQNSITALNEELQSVKEFGLDNIAWLLANILIENMSASIVDWINGGFEGEPQFISNLGGFLADVADKEIGTFINGSELSFLCSPFKADVRAALQIQYQPFQREIACTLTDVTDNIDDFVNGGNFSAGGWDGWYELSTKPRNNPYGAVLVAKTEADARVSSALQEKLEQLGWGNGFKPLEKCVSIGNSGEEECETLTPGTAIEDALNDTLDSGQRRLEMADELNEVIAALLNQLISQALGGSGGLRGLSQPRGPENTSYLDDLRAGSAETREQTVAAIEAVVRTEQQYRNQKFQTLNRVRNTKVILESPEFQGCSYADTQWSNRLIPLEGRLETEVAAVDANIAQFRSVQTTLRNATSDTEVRNAIDTFNRLPKHNQNDIRTAEAEFENINSEMSSIENTAQQACDNSFDNF